MPAISPRNGSICIRCAFRLRLLALQQQRRPRSHAAVDNVIDEQSPQFVGSKSLRDGTKRRPDSVVRKFLTQDIHPDAHSTPSFRRLDSLFSSKSDRVKQVQDQQDFKSLLKGRLAVVKEEVKDAPVLLQLAKDKREIDGKKEDTFSQLWRSFTQSIFTSAHDVVPSPFKGDSKGQRKELWEDLESSWKRLGTSGLDDRIKYNFYGHVTTSRFTTSDLINQTALADLRFPTEWYPATRRIKRKIHLHVGPTNSGKTYRALQRLEQSGRGIYAGPLRLLAHEVYTRMNAKGKRCALITGEERRRPEGDDPTNIDYALSACTVEMIPLNNMVDVAVIDEIQMIGSPERGWAWTQALLGVMAKEVHLCGEARTVPLIKELCASVGEELEIHEYQRLSPLQMADRSLDSDLTKLRKGDCIVSFSVMGIHALRRQIEKRTRKKVAIVYGSLPPETRATQARLFNDPNNDYDFLVASDAVGMGLNLAIKRVVFETSSKFDGVARRTLSIADIKQIGGRAGRFRTAAQATEKPVAEEDLAAVKGEAAPPVKDHAIPENVGLVTTLERFDFPIVASAMKSEPEPILTAGLFPPAAVLERFSSYFPPGTPFSYILTRLHETSQIHRRFHLCGLRDVIWVADLIEPVEGLTVTDRNNICNAPCGKVDAELWRKLMPAFAKRIAQQHGGGILDIEELPLEVLEADMTDTREHLRELERLHKAIVTYLWLSYRFSGVFNTRALAFHVKTVVEQKIEDTLGQISFSETQRKKLAKARERQVLEELLQQQEAARLAEERGEKSTEAGEQGEEGSEKTPTTYLGEEPSSTTDDEPYVEPEIGAALDGERPQTTEPSDGAFAGEPYLGLEEEPHVGDVRDEDDTKSDGVQNSRDGDVDASTIIEELTRHEGDIPRRSANVSDNQEGQHGGDEYWPSLGNRKPAVSARGIFDELDMGPQYENIRFSIERNDRAGRGSPDDHAFTFKERNKLENGQAKTLANRDDQKSDRRPADEKPGDRNVGVYSMYHV